MGGLEEDPSTKGNDQITYIAIGGAAGAVALVVALVMYCRKSKPGLRSTRLGEPFNLYVGGPASGRARTGPTTDAVQVDVTSTSQPQLQMYQLNDAALAAAAAGPGGSGFASPLAQDY